jgi:cell division topological specificity factor
MSLLNYFRKSKTGSASVAKERLQILIAHEHGSRGQPSYFPKLQKELLAVVQKYVKISQKDISVKHERDENQDILEVNIILPDEETSKK